MLDYVDNTYLLVVYVYRNYLVLAMGDTQYIHTLHTS